MRRLVFVRPPWYVLISGCGAGSSTTGKYVEHPFSSSYMGTGEHRTRVFPSARCSGRERVVR